MHVITLGEPGVLPSWKEKRAQAASGTCSLDLRSAHRALCPGRRSLRLRNHLGGIREASVGSTWEASGSWEHLGSIWEASGKHLRGI